MNVAPAVLRPGIDFAEFSDFLFAVHAQPQELRRIELLAHADMIGRPLPMPAESIMMFEDAGAVVDLETGWITWPSGIKTAVLPAESVPVAATEKA